MVTLSSNAAFTTAQVFCIQQENQKTIEYIKEFYIFCKTSTEEIQLFVITAYQRKPHYLAWKNNYILQSIANVQKLLEHHLLPISQNFTIYIYKRDNINHT